MPKIGPTHQKENGDRGGQKLPGGGAPNKNKKIELSWWDAEKHTEDRKSWRIFKFQHSLGAIAKFRTDPDDDDEIVFFY